MGQTLELMKRLYRERRQGFKSNIDGAIGISSVQALVLTVVTPIIVLLVLASLATLFFDSLAAIAENMTLVDLGTSTAATIAETILTVLVIVVLIGGAIFFVGLATGAFKKGGR